MSLEIEGLLELRRDLRVAAARVRPEAESIVERGALAIKQGMARDAAAATPKGYAKFVPQSISYDRVGLEAEIGADKAEAQGPLYSLMAFGSRNNAAVLDHAAPLEAEGPVVAEHLGALGERLLQ